MTNEYPPQDRQPTYEVPPNQGGYQQQNQPGQPNYGYAPPAQPVRDSWGSAKKDKWAAAVLAFMLGAFGIHKFYLGYKNEGMIMLLVSLIGGICAGTGIIVMLVISMIEAAKYVMMTQEDFERIYVYGTKAWF